ncbi:MAG TPA: hypothetical protein ENJ18_12920 [Nannocystis exedens]|nr:hypothetical protein [Nannocystis exedens]
MASQSTQAAIAADAPNAASKDVAAGMIAPVRVDSVEIPLEPVACSGVRQKSALEVALVAEAKWRASRVDGASKDDGEGEGAREALLTAAKARAELGHRAHAVVYLEAYLADGRADPAAEALLRQLMAGLVPVEIEVDADPQDSAITVEIDFYGEPSDVLPPLILPLERVEASQGIQRRTVLLTPGKWNVAVPEDGYYGHYDEDVELVAGTPAEVRIVIRADASARMEPAFIGIRTTSSPFLLGVVGIGLLAGGQVQYRRALARTNADCAGRLYQCSEYLMDSVALRSAGTGLLGASLGVGTALLSGRASKRRTRAIIWGIESGIGLGALVGGAIGVSFATGDFNGLNTSTWEDPAYRDAATGAAARHSGSAFVLGFGTSLLVYSVYYLLSDQVNAWAGTRRRRLNRGRVFALSPSGGVSAGSLSGGVIGRF